MTCKKQQKKREGWRRKNEDLKVMDERFQVNGTDIENVGTFKYLGHVLNRRDNENDAVMHNLQKASGIWQRIRKLLLRDRENKKTSGIFFKAVVR